MLLVFVTFYSMKGLSMKQILTMLVYLLLSAYMKRLVKKVTSQVKSLLVFSD